jgi:transcriptional regulator with XRE-family HTH domain
MSIAERIRTARRKAGLTQSEVAQRARISQPVVCRLENIAAKGHKIDPRTLERVAKALDMSADYLRSGKK